MAILAMKRRDARTVDPAFRQPMFPWPEWLAQQAEQIPTDEWEEDGKHVIHAALPGIDPELDVEVTVEDGVLHIRAEHRERGKAEAPQYLCKEIQCGALARDIALPAGCAADDVVAHYADGVLIIELALGEQKAAATTIPVVRDRTTFAQLLRR